MTYKNLIDTLQGIITSHRLINQFGYGNISDIETPESGAPNYPYVFINPASVSIETWGTSVTLNIIAMDQGLKSVSSEIDTTSRMLAIVQDILAQFKTTAFYEDIDVQLTVNCTPFKERFKDDVIGVTAIITFEMAAPLDSCDAPFPPVYDEIVSVYALGDADFGPEVGESTALAFFGITLNDGNWNLTNYNVQETATYRFDLDIQISLNTPAVGEALPNVPVLIERKEGFPPVFLPATVATGWPTVFVDNTTVYNVTLSYTVDAPAPLPGGYTLEFVSLADQVGIPESTINMKADSGLKIYKAN